MNNKNLKWEWSIYIPTINGLSPEGVVCPSTVGLAGIHPLHPPDLPVYHHSQHLVDEHVLVLAVIMVVVVVVVPVVVVAVVVVVVVMVVGLVVVVYINNYRH